MEQFLTSILSISTIPFLWICIKSLMENLTSTVIEKKLSSITERLKKGLFSNFLLAICLSTIVLIFNIEKIEDQINNSTLEISIQTQWGIYILSVIFVGYILIYLIYLINLVVDFILSIKPDYYVLIEEKEWRLLKTTDTNKYLLTNSDNELLILNSLDNKIIITRYKAQAYLSFIYIRKFKFIISLFIVLAIIGLVIFVVVNDNYIRYPSLMVFVLSTFTIINLLGNKLFIQYKEVEF